MLPFAPSLSIREITVADTENVAGLINRMLARSLYSVTMDGEAIQNQLFSLTPSTVYPVRWQRRQVLGTWRAGELIGLLDIAAGLDSESTELPDYQPLGLIRFLVLPEAQELVNDAAAALLGSAEQFWRQARIGHIKAFHMSTGYPQFQAGAGLLPSEWSDHIRALTAHDYRFQQRYYCLYRQLDGELLEEVPPRLSLGLVMRGTPEDRHYQVFFRRTELIGEARLVVAQTMIDGRRVAVGHLAHWEVDQRWRNQKVGRWLLRRLINDASQRNLRELVVFLQLHQSAAMNLVAQHGFVEHNYRGYTLEKALPE